MTPEADTDQESTADEQGPDGPRVQIHTGLRLEPAELEDLPDDVRDTVEEHIEFSDAYELELRDWGDGVVNIIHRYAPDEEVRDGE